MVMPSRVFPFVNGQLYHIYNRGIEKRAIFDSRNDHHRFIKTMRYYQLQGPKPRLSNFFRYQVFKPNFERKIVDIVCYCLMPNHFHFLIKQLIEGGITEFVSKLSNSYTKYFNAKNRRVGPLLQGEFKAVLIESDEQLMHVSRYIHLNPLVSYLIKDLKSFEWSSYQEYTYGSEGICNKADVLAFFRSSKDYEKFVLDQADYGTTLEIIKHQLIEET